MSAQEPKNIKIELTEQQKQQIKNACGEDVNTFEFSVEQLEDRVAPLMYKVRMY